MSGWVVRGPLSIPLLPATIDYLGFAGVVV